MNFNIAVIRGDGIGSEIIDSAVAVLEKTAKKYNRSFNFRYVLMGGAAIDETGVPLPDETVEICRNSDSVLLGAVGGPKWDSVAPELRPEKGLLGIRKALGLYANLRPALLHECLSDASPLKPDVIKGADIMVVRELTGGIYFGEHESSGDSAFDVERYSRYEIERIAKRAFDIARLRKKRVVSVDKANVLASSKLWRSVVSELAKDYTDIELSHMYVDNAAMQLAVRPASFDVILTSNMFGDILSDLASACVGSIGMLPSASLSDGKLGLYEPIHGSAPDIAGTDTANPIATILCSAMMLRISFGLEEEACAVENAVSAVLNDGYRTADIMQEGKKPVGCSEMARLIADRI